MNDILRKVSMEFEKQPDDFYAQVILIVTDQAPLLATPRLARQVVTVLDSCVSAAPGELWGYVVLPDAVRLIVGPTGEEQLETFVDLIKQRTGERLINTILRADDDSLDAILRYNPVWGGVSYQVWQPGSHRAVFWTEYKLSNALYDLRQAPVEAGLVALAGDWPYTWIAGNT
jgi:REP element-mobilizing transposase RayT